MKKEFIGIRAALKDIKDKVRDFVVCHV